MANNNWVKPGSKGDVDDDQVEQATKKFSNSELNGMRDLLDDPDVSKAERGQMLMALSNAGMVTDEEIDKYAGKLGLDDPDDIKDGGEDIEANLNNAKRAYRVGQRESHMGKIDKAEKNLDDPNGFKTSDEIIDETKAAEKLFEDFHPKYLKAESRVGKQSGQQQQDSGYPVVDQGSSGEKGGGGKAHYTASGNTPDDIRKGLDHFRGIVFGTFNGDAGMLENAGKKLDQFEQGVNKSWQRGTSDWLGDAKFAASKRNDDLNRNMGKLSQALKSAPGGIREGIKHVRDCVVQYARQTLALYDNGRIGGIVPVDVDKYVRVLDDFPAGMEQLQGMIEKMNARNPIDSVAVWVTRDTTGLTGLEIPTPFFNILGHKFAGTVDEDNVEQELEKAGICIGDAKTALQKFMTAYDGKVNEFHGIGKKGVSAIQQNYDATIKSLNDLVGEAFKEKGGSAGDKPQTPAGQQQAGPSGGPAQGGGSPPMTGGGPAQSAGPPPGAQTPSPSASVDPAAATGEQAPGETGQGGNGQPRPGDAGEGKNPVTGGRLETDPETGEPYPIDPATGEAVKDGTERDTLTVEQGDKKFELAEPNAKGEMEISVEDGKGPLKDYKLDFGNGDEASGGAQPGGQTEGGSGQSQGSGQNQGPGQAQGAGQGQGAGEPRQQEFGPQGSADGAEDAQNIGQGEKVYTPDEDGKIRIQDGDTEIVAEQPDGPDGPTKVTVNDGNGEPTTYTLGEEQGEPSAAGGGSGIRPGGGGAEFAGDGTPAEAAGMVGPEGAVQDGAAEVGPGSENAAQAASAGGGAADAGSVAGDLASGGGGSPAQPDGEAMQAGAAPGPPADAAGAMSGSMGATDGGSPEFGADGQADVAGQPGVDQPAAADAGGSDDSTSPAASLGSSLGEDALGGGSGEAADSSLGDAGMGGSAAGDSAADTGDGDNGGSGGSGDRGGGSGGAGMGGGMMGGGMGGAGGGGGGGDEERQSQFILDAVSDLFGEAVAGNHITGTIGEGAQAVSFSR